MTVEKHLRLVHRAPAEPDRRARPVIHPADAGDPPALEVTYRRLAADMPGIVVEVVGEADLIVEDVFQDALMSALDACAGDVAGRARLLVVDVSRAFIDVRGLTVLLQVGRRARRRGVVVALVGATDLLCRLLTVLSAADDLRCYPSVLAALTAEHAGAG